MDPLTETMALLRPQTLLWKQLDAAGDWIARFPTTDGVVFSLVASGRCLFRSSAHGDRELIEGDFLLMARPSAWSLSDNPTASVSQGEIHSGPGVRYARIGALDGGAEVRIVGGRFVFSPANQNLLEELLPSFLVIPATEPGATRLRRVLDLVADEAAADRPGRALALHRLLELLLIEVVRHAPGENAHTRGGLLAGLADARLSSALTALHGDVRRAWTVSDLAKICGMSRSMFAEKFTRVIGLPPIDYLLRWRMALAKDALLQGRDRLGDVARRCGYQSVSAFSAAFTRTVGRPPSQFAAAAANEPAGPLAPGAASSRTAAPLENVAWGFPADSLSV